MTWVTCSTRDCSQQPMSCSRTTWPVIWLITNQSQQSNGPNVQWQHRIWTKWYHLTIYGMIDHVTWQPTVQWQQNIWLTWYHLISHVCYVIPRATCHLTTRHDWSCHVTTNRPMAAEYLSHVIPSDVTCLSRDTSCDVSRDNQPSNGSRVFR